MQNISDIDVNFKVETELNLSDVKFYNCEETPFKLYGIEREDDSFRRIPRVVADSVSEGVAILNNNSAGGRLRFKTDSEYVAINVETIARHMSINLCLIGACGFDLYSSEDGEEEKYCGSFAPPADFGTHCESVKHFGDRKLRQITINFPPYHTVKELYIGLNKDAKVLPADDYRIEKPIVYYGSSITQGACASRPGRSYQNIISRKFNADYLNLGFSGNARGERVMADYIKNLPMSVFVYDYDHNAPNVEYLQKTHEEFFRIIREENPELPIIIMSRPKYYLDLDEEKRLEVIKNTYNNAIKNSDKNVYFIDGKRLMKIAENEGTVDDCHPNDLGFYSMATAISEMLENILK